MDAAAARTRSLLGPLPLVMLVLMLVEAGWFVLNVSGRFGPPIVGALPLVIGGIFLAYAYGRAWKSPGLSKPGRRFWRLLTVAACLAMVVTLTDLPAMDVGPKYQPGPIQMALFMLAMCLLIVALYRLPLGLRSRSERLRLLLDAGTVTLAASLFTWYFSFGQATVELTVEQAVTNVIICTLMAVSVFAIVKVLLTESSGVHPTALRLYAIGMAIHIVGMVTVSLVPADSPASTESLTRSLSYLLFVTAAVLQRRSAGAPASARASARRPFSVLPYVAVASVDALLVGTTWRHGSELVVSIVAVSLTGLVVARQIAAFRDNARLLDQLARQERRFRSLVQNAADVIAIVDETGVVTYVSPGVERLTGLPVSHWLGRQGFSLHDDDLAATTERFAAVLANPAMTVGVDARIATADGEWRWIHVVFTNSLDDPAVAGIVANISDINEARAYHEQLSHQASHDSLTDLANRSLFGEELTRVLSSSDPTRCCLALIDLDDFKTVNDTMGHPVGDQLLIAVAERMRRSVRPQDIVARLGGDEFALLLTDVSAGNAQQTAERVLAALGEPLRIDGHELLVQASIGIAEACAGEDVDTLMSHADIAMYAAKAAGKGQIARYADHMAATMSTRATATAELHEALTTEQFVLHYQPIVALPHRRITGVEALLRWNHPERGLVPPLDFIPLAEQTGLIIPIGRWVLRQACRQAAQWLAEYPQTAPDTVSVNMSARQLCTPSIVDDVRGALDEADLEPRHLIVEITETAVLDSELARAAVRELREFGVRVALDDFGTGHSSLSLIHDCEVDQLKLDRSFLNDTGASPIAIAVLHIAEALGIEAVAEGAETTTHADYLQALGYPLAQGFYFARPSDAAGIAARLSGQLPVDPVAGLPRQQTLTVAILTDPRG